MSDSRLTIILPMLNEAAELGGRLRALAPLREAGVELIAVDGGSVDASRTIAAPLVDRLIDAPRGRAVQMNAGAWAARGDVLLFLHADTLLPPGATDAVAGALRDPSRVWGRFDVRIEGRHPLLPLVAALMNLRSRATGIATGDQGIFVRKAAFAAVGGFPVQPLMEDIALSRRLRAQSWPACLRQTVTTSSRRWDTRGFARTVLLMWSLRLAYRFGAPPAFLAKLYGYG